MPKTLPDLDETESPLQTEKEHEEALSSVCQAAAVIIAERGREADKQQRLPASTRELLRRLPRAD